MSSDDSYVNDFDPADQPPEEPPQPRRQGEFKRLIICCDGTWNSSDKGDLDDKSYHTNVTRICRAIAKEDRSNGRRIPQIVLYQSGVGTGVNSSLFSNFAGGTGFGLKENVMEAYHFLVNNYEEGDEIFLFGFSRGSFTARSIAGFVADVGILCREVAHKQLPEIWKQYKTLQRGTVDGGDAQWQKIVEQGRGGNAPPKIKVVGCWDTVGSLGIPENWFTRLIGWNRRHGFHNTQLSPLIENAFHALALDEHRTTFVPTLWYLPKTGEDGTQRCTSSDPFQDYAGTTLKQCWFPGVHTDVGRGYDDHIRGDFGDLSLAWMIDQCKGLLAFEDFYKIKEVFDFSDHKQEPALDESKKPLLWDDGTPKMTDSKDMLGRQAAAEVYGGAPTHDSMTSFFKIFGTSTPRTPGQYKFKEAVQDEKQPLPWYSPARWIRAIRSTLFGQNSVVIVEGDTMETFHPSVRAKMLNDPYWISPALPGFRVEKNGDKWTWTKEVGGVVVAQIDEEAYPRPGSISRMTWYGKIQRELEAKGANFPPRRKLSWWARLRRKSVPLVVPKYDT